MKIEMNDVKQVLLLIGGGFIGVIAPGPLMAVVLIYIALGLKEIVDERKDPSYISRVEARAAIEQSLKNLMDYMKATYELVPKKKTSPPPAEAAAAIVPPPAGEAPPQPKEGENAEKQT